MLSYLIVGLSLGRDSYGIEPLNESADPLRTTSRLSLARWSSHRYQERRQNSIPNVDQHFRFTQNLRQGLPVSRETSMTNNRQAESVIDQLATNMVQQKTMPQPSPKHASMFCDLRDSKVNDLQTQIQQVTPPFNLSM